MQTPKDGTSSVSSPSKLLLPPPEQGGDRIAVTAVEETEAEQEQDTGSAQESDLQVVAVEEPGEQALGEHRNGGPQAEGGPKGAEPAAFFLSPRMHKFWASGLFGEAQPGLKPRPPADRAPRKRKQDPLAEARKQMSEAIYKGDLQTFTMVMNQTPETNRARLLSEPCHVPRFALETSPIAVRTNYQLRHLQKLTPLQMACIFGREQVVKVLAEAESVDLGDCGKTEWPPVLYAAACFHVEIVRLLLHQGVRAGVVNWRGQSLIHIVMEVPIPHHLQASWMALLEELVDPEGEMAAMVDSPDYQGNTPLMTLASCPGADVALAHFLLDHGAEINSVGAIGRTALSMSVDMGNLGLFTALLHCGADLFLPDAEGFDALHLAASHPAFAAAVMKRPRSLLGLTVVLSLVEQFVVNIMLFPAMGPEFRKLAEQATDLAVALIDTCQLSEAHYLLQVPPPPGCEAWGCKPAIETAADVNCKRFLATANCQTELLQMWNGMVWSHRAQRWALPASAQWAQWTPLRAGIVWDAPKSNVYSEVVLYIVYLAVYFYFALVTGIKIDADWDSVELALYVFALGLILKEVSVAWRLKLEYVKSGACLLDALISLVHVAVLLMRMWGKDKEVQNVMYMAISLNVVLSSCRLFLKLTFSPIMGPIQLIFTKIVKDVLSFAIILCLFILVFSVGLFAIYKNQQGIEVTDRFEVDTFEGIVRYLVWSIFLRVPLSDLLGPLHDQDPVIETYTEGLYALFQISSSLIAKSILVATIASTYSKTSGNMDVEWKTAWAVVVLKEHEERSVLVQQLERAPPCNLAFALLFALHRTACAAAHLVEGLIAPAPPAPAAHPSDEERPAGRLNSPRVFLEGTGFEQEGGSAAPSPAPPQASTAPASDGGQGPFFRTAGSRAAGSRWSTAGQRMSDIWRKGMRAAGAANAFQPRPRAKSELNRPMSEQEQQVMRRRAGEIFLRTAEEFEMELKPGKTEVERSLEGLVARVEEVEAGMRRQLDHVFGALQALAADRGLQVEAPERARPPAAKKKFAAPRLHGVRPTRGGVAPLRKDSIDLGIDLDAHVLADPKAPATKPATDLASPRSSASRHFSIVQRNKEKLKSQWDSSAGKSSRITVRFTPSTIQMAQLRQTMLEPPSCDSSASSSDGEEAEDELTELSFSKK